MLLMHSMRYIQFLSLILICTQVYFIAPPCTLSMHLQSNWSVAWCASSLLWLLLRNGCTGYHHTNLRLLESESIHCIVKVWNRHPNKQACTAYHGAGEILFQALHANVLWPAWVAMSWQQLTGRGYSSNVQCVIFSSFRAVYKTPQKFPAIYTVFDPVQIYYNYGCMHALQQSTPSY